MDDDLVRLIEKWTQVPPNIKAAVLALMEIDPN
jgi:hypothetical protein